MANTVFKLRRSSVAGKVPNTATLSIGELALNLTDRKLYSSDGSNIWETGANLTTLNVSTNTSVNNLVISGGINANGGFGNVGQILASNGSSVYWFTVTGTGTVTQVNSGNGLSGGPITTSGTLDVLANTGIISNTSGLFVNSSYIGTLTANNTSFVGSVSAANVVSNAQLSANLSNYQTTSGLNANIASYLPTYTGVVNATTISTGSVNVINASGLTTTANVNIGATGELVISPGAGIFANGGLGSAGQVLTSNASSIYWSTVSGGGGTGVTFSEVTGTTQAAQSNYRYALTNASSTTVTLPASPSVGDIIYIIVCNNLNNNIIARNGNNIMGLAEDLTMDINFLSIGLVYVNAVKGWWII